VKIKVQHITEGNELYWEEVEVPDEDIKDGVYTGKPKKGTADGLRKARPEEKRAL
jgi:hypothetical protein